VIAIGSPQGGGVVVFYGPFDNRAAGESWAHANLAPGWFVEELIPPTYPDTKN